jgi:signal transduction histidine kinase
MWNLPLNLAAGDNYDFVLEALLAKVVNPVAFLERVEYLYTHSQETACGNIMLKDGRTIERYGTPLHGKDGTYYGRISYFRDVTDRIYANDQRQSKLLRSRIMKSILAAREDEQRRIARDLHDIIGQSLVSVGLGLEMAKTQARKALKLSTLEELQKMVSAAVADVRLLSRNLRPTVLDDLGLIAALHHMLREHGEQNHLQYDLQHDHERMQRLPEYLETALFRIAQESLTNIVKHAQATHVNIVLKITPVSVELTIRDNGCGFYPEEVLLKGTNGGMGLLGIQERIDLLQGSLELRSRPGDGTTLIVSAPCEENFDVCNTDLHR